MPDFNLLQWTVRERLASGSLPRSHSDLIWGGYGHGAICSLCGEPIRSTEVEFEVSETATDTNNALRFHIPCHEVWQLECESTVAA